MEVSESWLDTGKAAAGPELGGLGHVLGMDETASGLEVVVFVFVLFADGASETPAKTASLRGAVIVLDDSVVDGPRTVSGLEKIGKLGRLGEMDELEGPDVALQI
jgi:hypothetical protein